jgi:hypothetical protein
MSTTPALDERQPLLPPPVTESGPPTSTGNEDSLDPNDPLVQSGELASQPVKRKVTAWKVVYWVAIAALISVGIFFLVKAIRDAEHVDVSTRSSDVSCRTSKG